jgi:hypothetical protein
MSARQTVARLEQEVAGLVSNKSDLQKFQAENDQLQTQLTVLRKSMTEVETERDQLLAERANIQSRIAGLSLILPPSTPNSQTSRSRKRHKRHSSPSGSDSRPRPKKRQSSSRFSRSPVANVRSDPDPSKQPDPNTPVQSPPTKPRPGRSKAKRQKGGSAKKKQSKHGSTTYSGGGGGGSGSDPSSSSSTGSHSGSDDLLSDATLARLPGTVVDRRKWFSGYRRPHRFSSRQVNPWPAVLLKHICIRKLQANDLFHAWSHPDFGLFPAKSATPARSSWYPHLITEANVRALYASEPWTKLRTLVVPHSFDPDGWFKHLYDQYSAFEDEERQTIWESTHSFPIGTDLRANSAYLDKLAADRKQRRSHAGPRWKKILTRFLEGMRLGHCDLDICLDPFFLHFPRKDEQGAWFPGLGQRRAPVDLCTALSIINDAEPWRNQFREASRDHPGLKIARLAGKFRPAASDSEDDRD